MRICTPKTLALFPHSKAARDLLCRGGLHQTCLLAGHQAMLPAQIGSLSLPAVKYCLSHSQLL
jgi:hypothetical protein